MMHKLPPLNALRAFEAVARNLSMTKAAEEFHVTHAAISQQIKLLENYLNIQLLHRDGKRISLTSQGKTYAATLNTAFSTINHATEGLLNQTDTNILTIRIPQTLALHWFIPRMQLFQNLHPEIELRLSTAPKEIDFSHDSVDLVIYYGVENKWHDLHKDFLFDDDLFPVCSPKLIEDQKIDKIHKNFSSYKFIYVTAELRKKDWQQWFEAAKLPEPLKSSRIHFQDTIQALQAAQAGLGFAIAHGPFVLDDIKSGRLIAPFKTKVKLDNKYYLVFPENYLHKNKVAKFREWLLKEK